MTLANLVIAGNPDLFPFIRCAFKNSFRKGRPGWPEFLIGTRRIKRAFTAGTKKAENSLFLFIFSQVFPGGGLRSCRLKRASACSAASFSDSGGECYSWLYVKRGKERLMKGVLESRPVSSALKFSAYLYLPIRVPGRAGEPVSFAENDPGLRRGRGGSDPLESVSDDKKKKGRKTLYSAFQLSFPGRLRFLYAAERNISGAPLEMYHYGELSEPLHQLLDFGTVPYLDTMPIHGVCDYFQAAVWYTLFDGTYASFEPAMIIGCVVIYPDHGGSLLLFCGK